MGHIHFLFLASNQLHILNFIFKTFYNIEQLLQYLFYNKYQYRFQNRIQYLLLISENYIIQLQMFSLFQLQML